MLDQTNTEHDQIKNTECGHEARTLLKYEKQDTVTYGELARECAAVAAWAEEQERLLGLNRRLRVGLLGSSSHYYMSVLLGVMSGGGAAVPLDIQMNAQTLADCLNRSEVDILFYDLDFQMLADEVEMLCPGVKQRIPFQKGRQIVCTDTLLEEYDKWLGKSRALPGDCAMVFFTSETAESGEDSMLSSETVTCSQYASDEVQKEQKLHYLAQLMDGVKISRSILVSHNYAISDEGENAAIIERFSSLNRSRVQAFCREHGISENVLFLTAYSYCIGIFSNQSDTVSSLMYGGRQTDSSFKTYCFRYTERSEETVLQLLKRNARQLMETMRCYVSNLYAGEMLFEYQGDILNIDAVGGYLARQQNPQNFLPFYLQVFSDAKGYFYELRYWENRFDPRLLAVFMRAMEAVAGAMLEEPMARKLKYYLPEELYPKHFVKKSWYLHSETRRELLRNVRAETEIKPYVLDDECRKKPFGAWGRLYIKDYRPVYCTGEIENPYGEGVLYQTEEIVRIFPDGKLERLEERSRVVMTETRKGLRFLNLERLEEVLGDYPGVEEAYAYVCYGENNQMELAAEIVGSMEPDRAKLDAYLDWVCQPSLIPARIEMIFDAEAENGEDWR